ncbi:hypothetical protein FHS42_002054 [Streptomyces zagrosensis]|uniref:Uncharacterized protein n=1 Tax=Streptomyces zagrosensis TaxID=1042984 RepID=A0A7W9Q7X7_9ACTN|nr:hypothetical protein [Streptomyces zagrosensis]
MVTVYDDLADAIGAAQRDLTSALDYARTHELKVDDSGRVRLGKTVARHHARETGDGQGRHREQQGELHAR